MWIAYVIKSLGQSLLRARSPTPWPPYFWSSSRSVMELILSSMIWSNYWLNKKNEMKRIENASSKQCHGSSVEADPEEEAWPKNGFRCQSLSSYQKLVGIGRGRIRTYVENLQQPPPNWSDCCRFQPPGKKLCRTAWGEGTTFPERTDSEGDRPSVA